MTISYYDGSQILALMRIMTICSDMKDIAIKH